MKKYELTDEVNALGLHRVRYLIDLPGIIKAGDLGGWIESEKNLSHDGSARVSGSADWMIVCPIGSRSGATTLFRETDRIAVTCGCFYGSLDEFVEKVIATHKDNEHAKAYLAMVEMAKIRLGAK